MIWPDFGQKVAKMDQKWGFWDSEEKICISFLWKRFKTKEQIIFDHLEKTACQKKNIWPRYGRKKVAKMAENEVFSTFLKNGSNDFV